MKIKTSELTGTALDWAVALIEYPDWKAQGYLECYPHDLCFDGGETYSPCTDWAQAGPIIEREGIELLKIQKLDGAFEWAAASTYCCEPYIHGPTPLIAAMRCYVASKLDDEVEIPDEVTP
jgi:hypothetical protein